MDQVEGIEAKSPILVGQFSQAVKGIESDDIGMPIIVEDHIHLGDAGDFVVNLDAEKFVFGKVVPVPEPCDFVIFK